MYERSNVNSGAFGDMRMRVTSSGYFFSRGVALLQSVTSTTKTPGSYTSTLRHPHCTMAFRRFLPMFDRVLVERAVAETVSKGGIMLPEKSQGKILQATVVAVGPGAINQKGDLHPVCVKVGEKVLLPEYGGTKVNLDDQEYFLFRDADILGKYVD